MSNQSMSFRGTWLGGVICVALLLVATAAGVGQDTSPAGQAQPVAETTSTPGTTPGAATAGTDPAQTLDAKVDEKSTLTDATSAISAEKADTLTDTISPDEKTADTPLAVPGDGTTQTPGSGTPAAGGDASQSMRAVLIGAVVIALFVLPILAGNYLARVWRMPEHGWKISLALGALAASLVIVTVGEFKFGPDLAGGITLIYEVEDAGGEAVPMDDLIAALKNRVDPTSTREVTIRAYGNAVEIIIPKTGQDALDFVKRRITELGQLEFRITAQPLRTDISSIIAQAERVPPGQKDVIIAGEKVAEWVPYAQEEFGPPSEPDNRIVKRMFGDTPVALVLIDRWNVTGEYLTSAVRGADEKGAPAVNFSFNTAGAGRFRQLTGENLPNEATNTVRHLGIILDKRLISAPMLRSTISDRGQISGGTMTAEEVDYTVGILQAGRLPAKLNKTPISEEVISPTLGAETVAKGESAIVASMVAVVIFMLVYYRFSGTIACIALTFNLLLVVALMVMISGAFTLPGLAGLVLTIGMSVDANVLIYERMREELRSGAALRMAIRNGFGRAMSAIIDANVTTIIAGVALYAFATDQVKGFAVTLILGILTSMFTAIFVSRLMFDIAERRGWLRNIRMLHLFPDPNIDFLKYRWWAIGFSTIVIVIGMIGVYFRGDTLLDIDFTGGSSVTFTLRESDKMPLPEVRAAILDTPIGKKNLVVVERGTTNTAYTIDTSEQSVDEVKRIVSEKLGDKLMKFSIDVGPLKPFTEGDFTGIESTVSVNKGSEYDENDGISHDALLDRVRALMGEEHPGVQPALSNEFYRTGSVARFKDWNVRMPGLDEAAAQAVFQKLETQMEAEPLFPLANTIGGRVSNDMKTKAVLAIFVSLIGVVVYLWLRFQKVTYGLAAAFAVVHDVLVTLGFLAISSYIVNAAPGLASALLIDSFQINLTIVAALLTIMGFSLNDTIVTFDRLREVKGKSPQLTADMVNTSVNQTLGRTILTALTVFIVVVILYFFGGEGIHGFAFSFLVGVIFGCYSSIYIAAPVLLWLSGSSSSATMSRTSAAIDRKASAVPR